MATATGRPRGRPRKLADPTAEPRRHERSPDSPIVDRAVSSAPLLAERMRAVALAWREADEDVLRGELRALADEAGLLAAMHPLPGTGLSQRQRIAAGRAASGRGAS